MTNLSGLRWTTASLEWRMIRFHEEILHHAPYPRQNQLILLAGNTDIANT